MSSDKKDLTRIEDIGEYIHQLSEEDAQGDEGLPELPVEEESSFDDSFSNDEALSEESTNFNSTDFDSSDFGTSEEMSFNDENTVFEDIEENTFELTEDPFAEAPSLDPIPEPETISPTFVDKTLLETPVFETPYKAPENFSDIKQFSESSSFTGIGAEGNPSFSVLIKNVRYLEDVNDIMILMKELGLAVDSEEQMRARLMRGNLLVPRISEFAAVLLAHKLRRFDIDIQVGLSDEIHPPKHGEAPETGIVSKYSLYQNQAHHFHFDDPKLEISHIIVAATPALEGYQVVRYLGVASEHKMLEGHLVEDETSSEVPRYYHELAQKLKAHALKAHSNAVIGLSYQLTPLPSEYGMAGAKYRLTCTGNLVWVNKL